MESFYSIRYRLSFSLLRAIFLSRKRECSLARTADQRISSFALENPGNLRFTNPIAKDCSKNIPPLFVRQEQRLVPEGEFNYSRILSAAALAIIVPKSNVRFRRNVAASSRLFDTSDNQPLPWLIAAITYSRGSISCSHLHSPVQDRRCSDRRFS